MIQKGTEVNWKWGNGTATGTVTEIHYKTTTRRIEGSEIKRKGCDENPAYVIKQEDGTYLLKLKSEVSRAGE